MTTPRDHLALALDVESIAEAEALARMVADEVGVFKVGLELFTRHGPAVVRALVGEGHKLFLDLKLHDIPETVGRAIRAAASLGADMVTVHASGGGEMLRRACSEAPPSLSIIAVTVLTSLDDRDLRDTGVRASPAEQASRLAHLAVACGVAGLVSSPEEVLHMRSIAPRALLVTPGIRPSGTAVGDQKRTMGPRAAIAAGADLLVVGRPIRDALDPRVAARDIARQIAQGLADRRNLEPT